MAERTSEQELFVLWPKARFAEERILADLRRETRVLYVKELRFEGDMAQAYRRFYGPSLPDARRKVRNCGRGAFLLVIVADEQPDYKTILVEGKYPVFCNARMNALKLKYRKWAGKRHRVHGTQSAAEFARDVRLLTGHGPEEWRQGVPNGTIAPALIDGWGAISQLDPFAPGEILPGVRPELAERKLFLENKYINDAFWTGTFAGCPAIEKVSTKAVWSIGNEYRVTSRMYGAAPTVVPCPLAWRYEGDGREASFISARVSGPSLTELLARGLSEDEANRFAADILTLARALKETEVVHRDLFTDNLLLDGDGHLKAIDWQLAIRLHDTREDPWVVRHWKFRYVVFGVNRDHRPGYWNDYEALVRILRRFPQTPEVGAAIAELQAGAAEMTVEVPPSGMVRFKLGLYALSLRLQMVLRGKRHRKYAQLRRRYLSVKGLWKEEEA